MEKCLPFTSLFYRHCSEMQSGLLIQEKDGEWGKLRMENGGKEQGRALFP
jgi:hypothetical protein